MSADVVALPGVVQELRGADPAVVEVAEKLLADTQAGVIAGFAYAALTSDGMIKWSWIGAAVSGNAMAGAIAMLSAAFSAKRLADYEED